MAIFHTFVFAINLTIVFLLQNLFALAQVDSIEPQSEAIFQAIPGTLKVELQSSESQKLIDGGKNIDFEVKISYESGVISNSVDEQYQSEFNEYCNYVEELRNTVLYSGGETFLNCTNLTRIVESNYTCNSSDGINCLVNATANSTLLSGNWSLLNTTNNITEIVKKVYQNVTSPFCVNSTTPLVSYKPTIHPPEYFNLTYQTMEIDIDLPNEFDINSVESLRLARDFTNVTLNCTKYVVNSTDTKHASKPSVKLYVQFSNVSWNGSMVISASVSERVVPKQLLNITGNIKFDGVDKELWIGSFTVPGLQFQSLQYISTTFSGTPGTLLTDEEEITLNAKFILPSVTTDIKVFVQLPVYDGSIPLKIIQASVQYMHSNIQSSNLRSTSGIGSNIVLTEVQSLNPKASTLVSFKFGKTVTSPAIAEKSVILSVTGVIDATERYDVYIPGVFGNITSWLVYSTAIGDETIQSPQWVETELGQPQLKYDMSFEKDDGKIEGGLEIKCLFQFYNPYFASEGASVNLDISFASEHMTLVNSDVKVCNVSRDTPAYCANTWPALLTISNTTTSLNIDITNLTAGFGVFGNGVSVILASVPASETLANAINIRYNRERWSQVSGAVYLSVKTQPITVLTQVISSSVDTTSQRNAAIGEKFTCRMNGAIPVTTNEDFVIVIGSDSSVRYGQATFVHVGENLAGDGLHEGIGLNITSGIAPYMGSSPVFFGQFGTVSSNGNSTQTDASTFIIEMTFFVKDINANFNGQTIVLTSKVYHNPGYRNYRINLDFKVVEPSFSASAVVSPGKDVNQNAEMSFVATIRRTSVSTAFNMMFLLAVPSPHLILTEYTSQSGTLRTVPGNQSPIQFLSPEDLNSTVIVYENDAVSESTREIRYKARTSSTLPASIFITSSFVMSYTSLPKNLNQSLARKYSYGPKSQPTFLTFRPDPFLNFSFESHNEGKFDAGDILNFSITLKNIGVGNVKPTAYSVKIVLPLSRTLFIDISVVCNQGSFSKIVSSQVETIEIEAGTFVYGEEIKCDIKATLNIVVPSQRIELTSSLSYHCLPTNNQHEYEGYLTQDENEIFIKELSMQLAANGSTSQVLCGDVLEFNMRIVLPEVTTNLRVDYEIPTIASNARGKRSARKKRASQINILKPDPSQTSYGNGGNLIISSMTNSLVDSTYTVEFSSVTNQPDNINSEKDVLNVQIKFLVANEPVIFSGRSFDLVSTVHYPGGSVTQTVTFSVVGPLVKPFLQLAKSFQVINPSLDSPSGIFYVNISHTVSSFYDAYDVNITDFIESMNVIRDNEFPGIEISAPTDNVYKFSSNIPIIAVGKTVHFYYKSKFKVTVKTPKYIRKTASVTWRSAQLNSPAYGPEINSGACVARNDTIKERDEHLYGFLALGAFLGLLIGFLMILICVCIFIKCCRKGRLVPYYRVLTGKTTYTALEEEESEDKSFTTRTNTVTTSVQQTESVIYIISTGDPKKTETELEKYDEQNPSSQLEKAC